MNLVVHIDIFAVPIHREPKIITMSHGKSSAAGTGSIHTPLQDVCPWQDENETVLVCDSVESDGRFVLCTLALQALAAAQSSSSDEKNGRILWLCCSPVLTDQLTLNALKKIGCNKLATGGASLPESSSAGQTSEAKAGIAPLLTIRSIPTLLEQSILNNLEDFEEEDFVKEIYRQVKNWLAGQDSRTWVILDDVSTLAALVGERLTYGLILSLRAHLSKSTYPCGLALRCSGDADIEAAGLTVPRSSDWFGAGGNVATNASNSKEPNNAPWERSLVELADTVVDVVPLASGYTREAHGRLIFTSRTTTTNANNVVAGATSVVFNYCLTDSQVLAIRIASTSR